MTTPLVLASASPARRRLLEAAGLVFAVDSARVNEAEVRHQMRGQSALATARELARRKATIVSLRHRGAIVVGADQILECGHRRYDKPKDREAARKQLLALRACSHRLWTAVACMQDGTALFETSSTSRLTMRAFSLEFLDSYLADVGEAVTASVGGYMVEGRGIQLFSRIEGDLFSVLGLPLLELLEFFRTCGLLMR